MAIVAAAGMQAFLSMRSVIAMAAAVAPARAVGYRNLYQVLRVKESASAAEIKAAYRSMAKRAHPDVLASAAAAALELDFLEIRKAYETLSDAPARARYDASIGVGRIGVMGGAFHGSRRWETDQCW